MKGLAQYPSRLNKIAYLTHVNKSMSERIEK